MTPKKVLMKKRTTFETATEYGGGECRDGGVSMMTESKKLKFCNYFYETACASEVFPRFGDRQLIICL